ncbi:DUF262 domain-containing protein [Emticicia fontis]
MSAATNIQNVDVQVLSFNEFFTQTATYPVGIDSYQRPYVWGKSKIQELIKDLQEYLEKPNDLSYYMGNILLHQHDEKQKLFIIDGQQRLTTLCTLYYVLHGNLLSNGKMALEYRSPISAKNILTAKTLFQEIKIEWQTKIEFLFNNLKFTFITTLSEDLAFTFFDTQNNRGVKLNPTDLLKAYHLRAIGSAEYINIQTDCATRWEKIQGSKTLFGQKKDFIAELFHQFIWRSRCWNGQKVIYRERDEDILNEFQKKTIEHTKPDIVPLYPNTNNALATALQLKSQHQFTLYPAAVEMSSTSAYLPFTFRQPISKGLGFFLFAEKYADLVKILFFNQDNTNTEIKAVRAFYDQVLKHISLYLKELYLLAIVMYFDKFSTNRLLEFTLWFDHVLGALRLDKYYIFKETTIKFLKETDNNIFDVISQSFRPDEVIAFLSDLKYAGQNLEITKIYARSELPDSGVRGVYKNSVLKYYNKTNLSGKANWITKNLLNSKL